MEAVSGNSGSKSSLVSRSGGSVRIDVGNRVLNATSTLKRRCFTIIDPSLPIQFADALIVRLAWGKAEEQFFYRCRYTLTPRADVHAVELNCLLFDVWGNYMRNLVVSCVEDFDTGVTWGQDSVWAADGRAEAELYFASLAFVARVRTMDGDVCSVAESTIQEAVERSGGLIRSMPGATLHGP